VFCGVGLIKCGDGLFKCGDSISQRQERVIVVSCGVGFIKFGAIDCDRVKGVIVVARGGSLRVKYFELGDLANCDIAGRVALSLGLPFREGGGFLAERGEDLLVSVIEKLLGLVVRRISGAETVIKEFVIGVDAAFRFVENEAGEFWIN
jgi:hypothetical protein